MPTNQISLSVHVTFETFFTIQIHKFNAVFETVQSPGHLGFTEFIVFLETTYC